MKRFWEKVIKTEGCWFWNAGVNDYGYGQFHYLGKQVAAHRVSYILKNGDIPDDTIVRHVCDNPACVNPAHLLLGDHAANVMDRVNRGRSAIGIFNGRAKLTELEVIAIYNSIERITKLAALYKVDAKTIRSIKQRKLWKHLTK